MRFIITFILVYHNNNTIELKCCPVRNFHCAALKLFCLFMCLYLNNLMIWQDDIVTTIELNYWRKHCTWYFCRTWCFSVVQGQVKSISQWDQCQRWMNYFVTTQKVLNLENWKHVLEFLVEVKVETDDKLTVYMIFISSCEQ